MVTVIRKEEIQSQALNMGVEGYLVKPVPKKDLIEAVASILKSEI